MEVLPNFLIIWNCPYQEGGSKLDGWLDKPFHWLPYVQTLKRLTKEHLTLSTIKLVVLFKSTMPMNTGFYI